MNTRIEALNLEGIPRIHLGASRSVFWELEESAALRASAAGTPTLEKKHGWPLCCLHTAVAASTSRVSTMPLYTALGPVQHSSIAQLLRPRGAPNCLPPL